MFKRTIIFLFAIVNNTLRLNKPQVHVLIDRAKSDNWV